MPAEEVLRGLILRRAEVAATEGWTALVTRRGMLVVLSKEARLEALDKAIEILQRPMATKGDPV